jgi:serine protease
VLHLKGLDIDDPVRAAENLGRQPEVLYAQPNYFRRPQSIPNDTNYSQQWQFDTINLPPAWDINPGGRADVVVAVLDTGVTTTTNTFQFPLWTGRAFQTFVVPFARAMDFDHSRVRVGTELALDGGWILPNGDTLLFDAVGHGTHVAGTIAQQTNNALGYAGVAYAVTLLPVKVCWSYWDVVLRLGVMRVPRIVDPHIGNCPDDAVVRGLRYAADNGARVINVSIGGTGASPATEDALRYAVERGAFVTISAGNRGDSGNPTIYPAAYAPNINGVVAVGAVNKDLNRARYSSFGPYVELVAPGGDGGASANEIWQIAPLLSDLSAERLAPRFDRYQALASHGTSMASPHVAGVAALLYCQGLTAPSAVEAALERFSRDLGPTGRDNEYGHGVIDARAALRGMGAAR